MGIVAIEGNEMKLKRVIYCGLAITALFLFVGKAYSSVTNEELKKSFEAITDETMRDTTLPGMIVGVWAPDRGLEWIRAKGIADRKKMIPMRPEMRVRIGSITKTFITTILLQLADEKKLSLDDFVSKYLPDFPNGHLITLRQLANMTSGVPSYTDDDNWIKKWSANTRYCWPPDELLGVIKNKPLLFEPGSMYKYSNSNAILLGKIIEKVTNYPLEFTLQDRIINRLKLQNTSFPDGSNFTNGGDYARGYVFDPADGFADVTEEVDPSWCGAAGAMISNLFDLRVFIESAVRGGLVSERMQAERFKFVPMEDTGAEYGIGIFRVMGYVGHNGALPGYSASAYHNPKTNTTIIILFNMMYRADTDVLFMQLAQELEGK